MGANRYESEMHIDHLESQLRYIGLPIPIFAGRSTVAITTVRGEKEIERSNAEIEQNASHKTGKGRREEHKEQRERERERERASEKGGQL